VRGSSFQLSWITIFEVKKGSEWLSKGLDNHFRGKKGVRMFIEGVG
jgi:hypothetical protein